MSAVANPRNPKNILTKWCAENNTSAEFKFSDTESNQYIKCEITLFGCKYSGIGKSRKKKNAEKNAIKDVLLCLLQKRLLTDISRKVEKKLKSFKVQQEIEKKIKINQKTSGLEQLDETEKKIIENLNENSEVKKSAETEESNNSEINLAPGNWTISTAKNRLKLFMESNDKNKLTSKCEIIGKKFVVRMSIFLEKINKTIYARQFGTTKKSAISNCALSLVNQLCGLGEIEYYSSTQHKKEKKDFSKNIGVEVNINEELTNKLYSLLEDLNIEPVTHEETGAIETKSLILDQVTNSYNEMKLFNGAKVILWCPPQSNWNPWSSCKINKSESLDKISKSMANVYTRRLKFSPALRKKIYDRSKLPIFNKKNEILDIIRDNSVVIVQGSTGCGKTTQVCQFILDDYVLKCQGAHCNIICTQPRKVSAISIANRVAFERAEHLGESVGYTVRFNSESPKPFGAILFCTVEILIRKLQRGLLGVSHVIVDEVHERRADCDFLLAILRDMVDKYPDLRVILMSANANLKVFRKYFNNCPVIDTQGHCYPVQDYFLEDIVQMLNYEPKLEKTISKKSTDNEEVNCNLSVSTEYSINTRRRVAKINEDSYHFGIVESLLTHIENKLEVSGGILIFLPGWAWIMELNNYLTKNELFQTKLCILLLHSTLSQAEQQKVFKPVPPGMRKVILSTNIAETSVTIDDVVFVIDYGKEKLVEFKNNITNYVTVWASKVNVEQRKGRAGRVKEGHCFKLYSKKRYEKLNEYILPELVRCPLTRIGLTIKLLKLGSIHTFLNKTIDPPSATAINNTIALLQDMKCLEASHELTALGCILAQLPIEPQFGRMMILGNIFKLGDALSVIAAGSSTDYDLFRSDYVQNSIKHYFSGNRCSDQLAFLNAFIQWDSSYPNSDLKDLQYFADNNLRTYTLDTVHNIKEQIINKFIRMGFPDQCFEKQNFDFGKTGIFDEPQLDMFPALLTMAFYPNIYCHKEKRKVKVNSMEPAIVCRSSVNNPILPSRGRFQSQFFVFEQQVHMLCKYSTMVSPIHLLLFGSCKVKFDGSRSIVLDNWIYLNMDVKVAAAIVALRPAIENIILRTANNPKLILEFNETDIKLIDLLKELCNFNAGRDNLSPVKFDY